MFIAWFVNLEILVPLSFLWYHPRDKFSWIFIALSKVVVLICSTVEL